ncbi:MAG: DAK2 domain-containing protein [Kiritimatiellia bacterium]
MTLGEFRQGWLRAQAAVRSREREFSELDAASGGDGDHGTAIVAALDAMVSAEGADFKESLERMAEALEERVSGSTSSLYGSWLEGMAGAVGEGVQELDEGGLAALFEGGLEEVEAATGARVGDKTLMDALIPATVALSKASGAGEAAMLEAGARAALAGAAATDGMVARFGRARNLGERSRMGIDAGAASMAAIWAALAAI